MSAKGPLLSLLVVAVAATLASAVPAAAQLPPATPPTAGPSVKPLQIYVTIALPVPTADEELFKKTKKEFADKAKKASDTEKTLEQQMKSQYGKRREDWPRDKQFEMRKAEEAANLAGANRDYLLGGNNPFLPGLRNSIDQIYYEAWYQDSADDIKKSIPDRKAPLEVVDAANKADLVVEVRGRKREPQDMRCIWMRIGAGGKMAEPTHLAQIAPDWRGRGSRMVRSRLSSYSPEAPYLDFTVCGVTAWREAAHQASVLIQWFVEDHYQLLRTGDGR
jgi:hypothetical protein